MTDLSSGWVPEFMVDETTPEPRGAPDASKRFEPVSA